ncbi:hypothetical protein C0992_010796 [Termitomyces sp. T32_za158]|nr:hypothetical protein C0992_010796 [Termitomyces sp. T32_za158]
MVTQDKFKLLALAKSHLGYPTNAPDEVVPTAYLDELLHHTSSYPYDTNFHLTLEPATGFGKVTCLEQGCNNSIISLDRHSSFPDGGLGNGLGSLSAYRDHVYTTHAKYQYDKQPAVCVLGSVLDYATSAYPPDVEMEQSCLPSVIDDSSGSPSNRHGVAQPFEVVNEYSRYGWDPTETKLPGCLSGSTAFPQIHSHKESSLVGINAKPTGFFSDIATTTSMWNVSSIIPATEITEAQLLRKRLSDADSATNHPAQIWQVTPDVKRRKLEEIPPNFNIPDFSLPNVESIRANISDIQDEIITDENVINSPRCKKKSIKVENTHVENAPTWMTSLQRHKDNLNASLASLSAVRESLSRFHTSTQEDTAVAAPSPAGLSQHVVFDQAPVASSSSLSPPHYYDIEDDDYMALNHQEYNDELACGVLQSIDPGIPETMPIQNYEYFDETGDYCGRSCDTFAGPQAKADDIDKFLIEAGNAQQFDGNAKLEQALEKLGLQSQYDLLPGMEVPLMPHQTIGVAWMIDKEESRLRGGCLADDMGLGKVGTDSYYRKEPFRKSDVQNQSHYRPNFPPGSMEIGVRVED